MSFPKDVLGLDYTKAPMTAPPEKETLIGYFSWGEGLNEYFVLPDGGAKIVRKGRGEEIFPPEEEIFPPGGWEVEWPNTSFGSRGGQWIRAK